MKASLQMRMDQDLIQTPIKKIRKRVVPTLSGKKSKRKNECLCQDIEFQRLLETKMTQIQFCTTLKKIEIQYPKAIFRAQAQTC